MQKAPCYTAPHKLADGSVTPLVGSSGPRHVVRLLARVLRPAALSQTSARRPVHETWWLLVRAEDQVRVISWPWLELPGSRLTTASGGAPHTFDASWSGRVQHSRGRRPFLGSTSQVPCFGHSYPGVAKRALPIVGESAESPFAHADDSGPLKLNRVPESGPTSATAQDSTPGRHLSHRLQWVQDLQRVVVFTRHVQRPVSAPAVARPHPVLRYNDAVSQPPERIAAIALCRSVSRFASVGLPAVIIGNGDADNPLGPTAGASHGHFLAKRLVRCFNVVRLARGRRTSWAGFQVAVVAKRVRRLVYCV